MTNKKTRIEINSYIRGIIIFGIMGYYKKILEEFESTKLMMANWLVVGIWVIWNWTFSLFIFWLLCNWNIQRVREGNLRRRRRRWSWLDILVKGGLFMKICIHILDIWVRKRFLYQGNEIFFVWYQPGREDEE